jgi:uncharacterized membrane protein YqjE
MFGVDGSQLLLLCLGILFALFAFVMGMVVLMCMVLKRTHRRRIPSRGHHHVLRVSSAKDQ